MNIKKKAFITGVTGQDGSYLAELLVKKGYDVVGLDRRCSERDYWRLGETRNKIKIIEGDLMEYESLRRIIETEKPDEIYNLAAQSHVGSSFKTPLTTLDMTGKSVWILLEIIRAVDQKIKIYQASTSELFGGDPGTEPQNEKTPFNPHSPYAIAKLAAFHMIKLYRESYGIFACNGILFNHESPRRGEDFVTRKITIAVARIKAGKQEVLELGNMDAKRDWGFAGDYVEVMYEMLQQDKADDYVISTGETHTVREFVEESFRVAGYEIVWEGKDEKEIGKDKKTGKVLVRINPEFFRPGEVPLLLGDNSKAKKVLGWTPKVTFKKLAKMMMEDDLEKVEKGLL
ncbi:MAG TPA: GDP-mannose 4,6-dehydratase [Patescibacteria group bacterium]|nr:GDP-mannose 4,6-dehydratase [Patescibacteria group bacterium]